MRCRMSSWWQRGVQVLVVAQRESGRLNAEARLVEDIVGEGAAGLKVTAPAPVAGNAVMPLYGTTSRSAPLRPSHARCFQSRSC